MAKSRKLSTQDSLERINTGPSKTLWYEEKDT